MSHSEHLKSALLTAAGFRHAFFTRKGGVSHGPYASLSFSHTVGDDPDNVRQNLERAAAVLGVQSSRIYFLCQVHGRDVRLVEADQDRELVAELEGDAVASLDPRVACGVRSADCVPVLLGDRRSGAAVAIHAGWRGTVRGVVEAGLGAIERWAGTDVDPVAAIGPHISVARFEVSEQVADELAAVSPDPGVVDRSRGPKPHVDLRRLIRSKLISAGLSAAAVDDVPGCTVSDSERFFSYRRDGARSGRHLSAIVPRPPR